jgi:hypothetical protein
MSPCGAALLQGQKLLRTESLVVNLACCLNQVLEVSASEKVSQINEFAVGFVFDIDDTPAVLSAANLLTIDNDSFFTADNGKWNNVLRGG